MENEREIRLRRQIEDLVRSRVTVLEQDISHLQREVNESFTRLLERTDAAANLSESADTIVEQIVAQVTAEIDQASTSSVRAGADIALLRDSVAELNEQRNQAEVLNTLVARAANFAPRVVLFVVKGGNALAWAARGFEDGPGNGSIRGLSISLQADTALRTAVSNAHACYGSPDEQSENQQIFSRIGNLKPQRVLVVPLKVRGKSAAVFFADSADSGEDAINVEAIELLVNTAGLVVELVSLRARVGESAPQPAAQPATAQPAAPAVTTPSPVAAAPAPPAPVAAPPPPPPPVAAQPPPPPPPPVAAPVTPVMVNTPAAAPDYGAPADAGFGFQSPVETSFSTPPPAPAQRVETPVEIHVPSSSAAGYGQTVGAPPVSEPPMHVEMPRASAPLPSFAPFDASPPPAPVSEPQPSFAASPPAADNAFSFTAPSQPLAPPPSPPVGAPSADEEKLHNDARRFARLLVSEIKLYNEQKVTEGRSHKDLYDRLKDDIDRSRQMYEKRVSPTVAAKFDYFYDEMVTTLAEGDASKLGSDYPGPSVAM